MRKSFYLRQWFLINIIGIVFVLILLLLATADIIWENEGLCEFVTIFKTANDCTSLYVYFKEVIPFVLLFVLYKFWWLIAAIILSISLVGYVIKRYLRV